MKKWNKKGRRSLYQEISNKGVIFWIRYERKNRDFYIDQRGKYF